MSYIFFFLLGIPLWLIPVAAMFSSKLALPSQKVAWAASTFLAPFLIFGLSAVAHLLLQQRVEADSPVLRGFGYFMALLNTIAFFSPFFLQAIFQSRYAAPQGKRFG